MGTDPAPLPMSRPEIEAEDVAAVVEVLRSGQLAFGPRGEELERRVAAYVGASDAVAVSSGTAALHVALVALGIGPGDEVLVPSFTFSASVSVILQVGARPVFVDVEPDVLTVDPADLETRITPRSRAILAVDVFGHPAPWDALESIGSRAGLRLIDDACEALGAEVRGRRLGTFGDATTFGFYPNKQITTGEGGMLVTQDRGLADLARSLRNQGRDRMGSSWAHLRLGYSYRLDEMSAALGASQMARLPASLARRRRVAGAYDRALAGGVGLERPARREGVEVSWFTYVVRLAPGIDRDRLIAALERRGIPSRAYFPAVHLQPFVREQLGDLSGTLPVTESAARRTLALPFHARMSDEEVERVVAGLEEALCDAGE